MLTEPLTNARKPEESDGPLGGLQISNLADDLAPNTVPYFTTASARDTAFSNWVAGGHSMRNGLHCYVDSIGDQVYSGGAWRQLVGSLVKTSTSTSSTATSGTAEQRLSGPQNIVCTLFAGRTYEVIACGDVQSSGPTAGSILALRIRAAEGATPTTSSAVVAGTQVFTPTSGGAGEVGWVARGEFQVGTGGSDWQVHLFGKVLSVATALTVVPDGRGVHSISIYDRGPATTDVPSI